MNFIEELENRSKKNISDKESKIKSLTVESDTHIEHNQLIESNVEDLIKEQEKVTGAGSKLKKLNNLTGLNWQITDISTMFRNIHLTK